MEDQRAKSGTSYVFCPNRDTTGTRPNIPGQLATMDIVQHRQYKCILHIVC